MRIAVASAATLGLLMFTGSGALVDVGFCSDALADTDVTPPVISGVKGTVINAKKGTYTISWTTDEASTSTVTLSTGETSSKAEPVRSHSISLRGSTGQTYTYSVSSKDAVGNSGSSGPYSITIR